MVVANAICWFLKEHGIRLSAVNNNAIENYLKKINRLGDISSFLKTNQIPRLSQRAQLALSRWIDGDWPIILSNRIPTPKEMLEIQAEGKRVVTWLPDEKGPILDKADNWEFMLHDLMHAERFFYSPKLYKAQVGFFRWLNDQALEITGHEWDYLRSDMNTHPLHALQFLKHLLDSSRIKLKFNIPHWDLINSSEFTQNPFLYSEDINRFFQNYL